MSVFVPIERVRFGKVMVSFYETEGHGFESCRARHCFPFGNKDLAYFPSLHNFLIKLAFCRLVATLHVSVCLQFQFATLENLKISPSGVIREEMRIMILCG